MNLIFIGKWICPSQELASIFVIFGAWISVPNLLLRKDIVKNVASKWKPFTPKNTHLLFTAKNATKMRFTKLIHEIRAVKSKKELANIVRAQRISEEVLKFVKLKVLKLGITEIQVANLIKNKFIKLGAPILSFEPIVAFGKNTADIHHFVPTKTKLKKGDIIMLDFGCTKTQFRFELVNVLLCGEPSPWQKVHPKNMCESCR